MTLYKNKSIFLLFTCMCLVFHWQTVKWTVPVWGLMRSCSNKVFLSVITRMFSHDRTEHWTQTHVSFFWVFFAVACEWVVTIQKLNIFKGCWSKSLKQHKRNMFLIWTTHDCSVKDYNPTYKCQFCTIECVGTWVLAHAGAQTMNSSSLLAP